MIGLREHYMIMLRFGCQLRHYPTSCRTLMCGGRGPQEVGALGFTSRALHLLYAPFPHIQIAAGTGMRLGME
jgi:hypothetical protein